MLVGFKNPTYEDLSLKEILEKEGLNEREVKFIPEEKLEKNLMDLKHYHKIDEKGTVEDVRKIVGYKTTLENKIEVKGKEFSKDTKTFKVDDREQAEELANKLNMEITDFEEIKKLPKT